MRVIGFKEFGGPEVLREFEMPAPHAGPNEVRIRVAAATVNPADAVMRSGQFPAVLDDRSIYVPGMEAAGFIDQVGEGAPWSVGARVMAIVTPPLEGAYAEHIVVPESSITHLPLGADYVSAATLPMNGLAARLSLDQLALDQGQTLAVTGAAGAYGGYVVQLAKAEGFYVIADASGADEALVHALGADVVVPRGPDLAARIREIVPAGVDGVADGAALLEATLPAIKDGGALAMVRTPEDLPPGRRTWQGNSERGIALHRTNVSEYARCRLALDTLREQVEARVLTLRVAATFAPEQAADAHRLLAAGGTRGRLVITF